MSDTGLDHGTYEVLRARLAGHAAELAERAEALNARRLETFGGAELRLTGTRTVRTERPCVPRDLAAVGGRLLFGANTPSATQIADVFALHHVTTEGITPGALPGLLDDPGFQRDFAELYRYYRQARLLRLRPVEGRLLAVFQTGPRLSDVRVLRWRIAPDGTVAYEDNRGERDDVFPPAHDFTWTETTRDDHVPGRFPHISIGGEAFVATIGGALTVKTADDTETATGVYSEPVDEPLQSLADADVLHARVGALILLRVRPYNETAWRHLVLNTRTGEAVRLDGIAQGCRRLPDDRGIVFPGGYYLDTGAAKTFDTDVTGLEYERVVRSPNGEDVLYVFHAPADGRFLLLPYNTIREQVANPIPCNGFALFDDGTLTVLRTSSDEPGRAHPLQVWQTPFVSDAHATSRPAGTGPLHRIGNADLVRGVSDCLAITRTAREMEPSAEVYRALAAACVRAADRHHWLGDTELGDLHAPLEQVRETATLVLDEHAKVQALTEQAEKAVAEAVNQTEALLRRATTEEPNGADGWVTLLAELRRAQGRVETLREIRYADTTRIDTLTQDLSEGLTTTGRRAADVLQDTTAFTSHHHRIEQLATDAAEITSAAEAAPITDQLTAQAEGLEVVTEVVGSLDIADATVRTTILEHVGEVLGGVNRARAVLAARRRDLLDTEGRAAFGAEFALLDQAIASALATADTPERCDERLGRLLLQVESLETRFADFEDYLTNLETKRTDIYEAFAARKQALLDERERRAQRLTDSADRILAGARRRAAELPTLEEVNTFFATDAMTTRLRTVAAELRELGDQTRADELEGRIKAARQEAGRSLRDRIDLYDGDTIRLGKHRFTVNTRPFELTLVPNADSLAFTVTGTTYRSPVQDESFTATKPFWTHPLPSEDATVYRAEYLAVSLLPETTPTDDPLTKVRTAAASRYDEGYERGVHDHDAAKILTELLHLREEAGLLRYSAEARAAAQLFWAFKTDEQTRATWTTRATSLVRAREALGRNTVSALVEELATLIPGHEAAEYLVEELAQTPTGFVTSAAARTLINNFEENQGKNLTRDLEALDTLEARRQLAEAWLGAYGDEADLPEAIAIALCGETFPRYNSEASLVTTVTNLLGTHPRITNTTLTLRLDETLTRVGRFTTERVPAFRAYQKQRNTLIAAEQKRLRLSEYQPKAMNGFVRNRLIDEVYLPLIGDNLAKQLGTSTDQMGLLLLISPPGYGKTTLLEYVAERLGLLMLKIDGPALGHDVTSLDPTQAPNTTARREIEKIHLAFELGDNVLLYLDDIQHTSPELLQKFIPLCDAQRRIEGHDLRGKRFAVCMAGNPYTESGTRFRIPDMLANRADVWNLGDVLSGREEVFALSYIENALTANPTLAPLTTRDRADIEPLVRMASGDDAIRSADLSHPYTRTELEQTLAVLQKLLRAQETVLAVNRAYMASAAQADESRTEPPFKLQGSYRDMNKLAARIVPVMNDDELEATIDDHYQGEAQTLTTDTEANLLKLSELRGILTEPQHHRWTEVKTAYQRTQALGGPADDPLTRAVGALALLADRVGAIESAIERAIAHPTNGAHRANRGE
ncbi:DNA repair ATPase [Actinomadura hibisca]|uniref:DNA repair ATPase n=1 Tax=Actinomadura hibisca TaxID=68565 RepID=UPI0008354B0E|nr:DNA repair ATPase [Actinomadura hibisca]